jgi:hypothetical protein
MAKFFSKEWIDLFREEINRSEPFANAARMYEDTFVFVVDSDETFSGNIAVFMDIYHGKCREIKLLSNPTERKPKFVYRTSYSTWKRIIDGLIDPMMGVGSGSIHVEGDMAEFLTRRRAASELVEAARRVPTEFEQSESQKPRVPP